jgi:hypothetical protein
MNLVVNVYEKGFRVIIAGTLREAMKRIVVVILIAEVLFITDIKPD